MKYILGFILSVGLAFSQAKVEPSIINAQFDIAKDTFIQLPDVNLINQSQGVGFMYNTSLGNYSNNISVWPSQGFVMPGGVLPVKVSFVGSGVPVGNYVVPISFVPVQGLVGNPNPVVLTLNLSVIDSRTFTIGSNPVIPHIASGAGWTTTVKLSNTSPNLSLVTLKFYDPFGNNNQFFVNGTWSAEYSVAVPGNGTTDIVLSDPSSLKTGSIELKTVYGSGVVAHATYSNSEFEAAIPSSQPNKDSFSISFDNIGRRSTGVALVNYLNYAQEVTFTFFDTTGFAFHTEKALLPANGQLGLTLDVAFPKTDNKAGTMRVSTNRPALTGFGLKFNLDRGYFTVSPIF